MNLLSLFRLLLFPLLLPFSLLYGVFAFVIRVTTFDKVELSSPVISVGNFCVGGSGKTPLVGVLIEALLEKGYKPVVISKSYKADLKEPAEVLKGADPLKYGDEAVSLKEKFKNVSVFSGPVKVKSAVYAETVLAADKKKVFIIDDGAQHHKLKKNFKIHTWDLSRPIIDILPFPFGMSREFWFLGEGPDLSVLNRSNGGVKEILLNSLIWGRKLKPFYMVKEITNVESGLDIKSDFVLISGLGNFRQLLTAVKGYIEGKDYNLIKEVPGKDHDDFKWFKADANLNYVCTEKDLLKLKGKVSSDKLFVVKSDFSEDFKKEVSEILNGWL